MRRGLQAAAQVIVDCHDELTAGRSTIEQCEETTVETVARFIRDNRDSMTPWGRACIRLAKLPPEDIIAMHDVIVALVSATRAIGPPVAFVPMNQGRSDNGELA